MDFTVPSASEARWALGSEPHGWHAHRRLDDFQRNLYHQPEKRLVLAVLEDAIACFQHFLWATDSRGKRIFSEARNWLWSDRDDWPFAYQNVCDVLGIDANYLRRGLVRWKQNRHLAKTIPGRHDPGPTRKAHRGGC